MNTLIAKEKKVFFSLIPIFTTILVSQFVLMAIYLFERGNPINFLLWIVAQAIGGVFWGYLSDRYSRLEMLLVVQLISIMTLLLLHYIGPAFLWTVVLGFFFNPIPITRATLIDNFPHFSKIKLIALTVMVEWGSWCFYIFFKQIKINTPFLVPTIAITLFLNCILCWLFLYDKKETREKPLVHKRLFELILPGKHWKFHLTLIAMFLGQIVFYLADTRIEDYTNSEQFFSMLGMAAIIGAFVAFFYQTTPHISILTLTYGLACLMSFVPIFCMYIVGYSESGFFFQMIMFANLGAFYIPFVYDTILNCIHADYRGTACGVIDLGISCSSLIGVPLITFFSLEMQGILISLPIFLGLAAIMQKVSE